MSYETYTDIPHSFDLEGGNIGWWSYPHFIVYEPKTFVVQPEISGGRINERKLIIVATEVEISSRKEQQDYRPYIASKYRFGIRDINLTRGTIELEYDISQYGEEEYLRSLVLNIDDITIDGHDLKLTPDSELEYFSQNIPKSFINAATRKKGRTFIENRVTNTPKEYDVEEGMNALIAERSPVQIELDGRKLAKALLSDDAAASYIVDTHLRKFEIPEDARYCESPEILYRAISSEVLHYIRDDKELREMFQNPIVKSKIYQELHVCYKQTLKDSWF